MLIDFLFDLALDASAEIIKSSWRAFVGATRGVRRLADVRKMAPAQKQTAVDYLDAGLFPEEGESAI